jgi:hypothetical protein
MEGHQVSVLVSMSTSRAQYGVFDLHSTRYRVVMLQVSRLMEEERRRVKRTVSRELSL